MAKDVSFQGRPPSKANTRAASAFLELGVRSPQEPMKRLTINVPVALHHRVKIKCVQDSTTIADVVRGFLEKKFPNE